MTPWLITQSLYVVAGGGFAPLLIRLLFARDHTWGAFSEAAPAFAIVAAVIALWPMLLLLVLEAE